MNNEQNMTQNIDQATQTAAEQANAAQTAAEQKLAKKKLTRRIFIGGGLGALAVVGGGAGWAYNRYLAEHTEIETPPPTRRLQLRQTQAPPAPQPQTPPN